MWKGRLAADNGLDFFGAFDFGVFACAAFLSVFLGRWPFLVLLVVY